MPTCFDISPLGSPRQEWTGVARVVEQFLARLRPRCPDLEVAATGSIRAAAFLADHLATLGLEGRCASPPPGPLGRLLVDRAEHGRPAALRWAARTLLRARKLVRRPLAPDRLAAIDFFFSFFAGIPRQVRGRGIGAGLFVHDLIPLLLPEVCRPGQSAMFRRVLDSLRPGDLIVTNSECTRRDVCERLAWNPADVHVVHLAADPDRFHPVADPAERERVARRYGLPGGGYFLSLHSEAAHKNMPLLVEAYGRYRDRRGPAAPGLVIAGGANVAARGGAAASPVAEGVRRIGFVADADLAAVYAQARGFFFPSLYEGFGLPVVEALACGVRPFVSDRGSLPELLAGDGTLLDPTDVEAWAAAFAAAETAPPLTADQVARVHARFDWDRATDRLLDLIRTAASRSRSRA